MESTPPPTPLGRLLAPARGPLAVAAGLQVIAGLATIVPFVCIAELAVVLLAPGPLDRGAVQTVIWIAVAALLVRIGFGWLAGAVAHQAAGQRAEALRRRLADQVTRLPLGWLTGPGPAALRRALTEDLPVVRRAIADTVLDLITLVVTATATAGYLLWVDWRLALISFVPLAVYVVVYPRLTRAHANADREVDLARGELNAAVGRLVDELRQIRTTERVRRARAGYDDAAGVLADRLDTWRRPAGGRLGAIALAALSGPLTLLLGLGVGTWFAAAGWLPPVDLVPFALLGGVLTVPLRGLERQAARLRAAQRAARELTDLLDRPALGPAGQVFQHVRLSSGNAAGPSLVARNAAMHAVRTGVRGSAPGDLHSGLEYTVDYGVEYSGVTLHDESGRLVVDEVDCMLRPHTLTAIVGATGSGKMELATLLARYTDPIRGMIRIGGVDVRDIHPDQLARVVGVVLTEPQLLAASVADNIRLGRPDASLDDVIKAARAARVDERVAALPRGYDSVVGADAVLSTSERLRITIARQLLTDPPVLILDEAVAYAEPEAEAATCDAIDALVAGRTTLVVAHRLSPVTTADQILVMNAGRVVERGRHSELLSRGGAYTALWASHERAIQRRYPSPVPGSREPTGSVSVR